MLSEAEKREIEEAARHAGSRRAVVPEALRAVQKRQGWVADDGVADIAEYLGVSPAEIDSIATFYTVIYRRPVGRHIIQVCDSVSCWIMGFLSLKEAISALLGIDFGETTPDDRFTLLPSVCLGACDHAPALMIDNDLHGDLTPERLEAIFANYP